MTQVNKSPKGVADVPHLSGKINHKKLSMQDSPNLGSFRGVRTTATSLAEGRLKVGAGATPKAKRVVIKKALSKLK